MSCFKKYWPVLRETLRVSTKVIQIAIDIAFGTDRDSIRNTQWYATGWGHLIFIVCLNWITRITVLFRNVQRIIVGLSKGVFFLVLLNLTKRYTSQRKEVCEQRIANFRDVRSFLSNGWVSVMRQVWFYRVEMFQDCQAPGSTGDWEVIHSYSGSFNVTLKWLFVFEIFLPLDYKYPALCLIVWYIALATTHCLC